jgi:hypothetical protein
MPNIWESSKLNKTTLSLDYRSNPVRFVMKNINELVQETSAIQQSLYRQINISALQTRLVFKRTRKSSWSGRSCSKEGTHCNRINDSIFTLRSNSILSLPGSGSKHQLISLRSCYDVSYFAIELYYAFQFVLSALYPMVGKGLCLFLYCRLPHKAWVLVSTISRFWWTSPCAIFSSYETDI